MIRHAYWIAGLVFVALILSKWSPRTGFTPLIRFGEKWQERRSSRLQDLPISTVPQSSGYDGQFYAAIALDPLLLSPELDRVIDAPAYRARRILAPTVAAFIGLGNSWLTLQAYALLNIPCWFALGWLLRRHLSGNDWQSFARWIGCMFSIGVLDSVRQSLVDLPALLFLALAVEAQLSEKNSKSTLWLALGNLTKETSVLGTIALYGNSLIGPARRSGRRLSLFLAVLPLALWALYVQQRFSGVGQDTSWGNFNWPLIGLLEQINLCSAEIFKGNFNGRYTFGLLAILGLMTQTWVVWRRPQWSAPWWRIGAIYSLLLIFLSSWVWSGYWAACRSVLPLTICFNLLLPINRWFWILWLAGNLTLLHGVWRFI